VEEKWREKRTKFTEIELLWKKMRERPIETLVGGREVEEELPVHSFHWVSGLFLVFRHLLRHNTMKMELLNAIESGLFMGKQSLAKSMHIIFLRQTMRINYKVEFYCYEIIA